MPDFRCPRRSGHVWTVRALAAPPTRLSRCSRSTRFTPRSSFCNPTTTSPPARTPCTRSSPARPAPGSWSAGCTWSAGGPVPSWAKDAMIGNHLVNARVETVHDKPRIRRGVRVQAVPQRPPDKSAGQRPDFPIGEFRPLHVREAPREHHGNSAHARTRGNTPSLAVWKQTRRASPSANVCASRTAPRGCRPRTPPTPADPAPRPNS